MLHRLRFHRSDEGQGLVIVLAVIAVAAILMVALEVSVVGDAQLAGTTTSQEQALQAAESGLADFQTYVNNSASNWQYVMNYCSSGAFTTCPQNPDPNNSAYVGQPDPSCTSSGSTSNGTWGTAGTSTYDGWETLQGTASGFNEQFQYVVDSTLAKSLGGYAHVFVTGRAGHSGHYTCSTVKALYNGPALTTANTVQLSPASCSGQTIPVTAPSVPGDSGNPVAQVEIEATGGPGQTGGSGGLSVGGGQGGTGETVEATFAASTSTTLYVTLGCQGGSNTDITKGGQGFSNGGSVTGGNAGGGGGSTAVCTVTPCNTTTVNAANLASNLYLVAAGGGGGGEGLFGANAAGGSGGVAGATSSVASGTTESGATGKNATAWFNIHGGGTGGAGAPSTGSWSPVGANGNTSRSFTVADGGAGGAGYDGGSGGAAGFGGGGGGAGSSFINTGASVGGAGGYVSAAAGSGFYAAGTTMMSTPSASTAVTIQWEDSSGNPIGTPVSPQNCGPYSEVTQQIPALTQVSMQVNGASGGDGSALGYLTFTGAGSQGDGSTIVATYQNTSTSPVDVTAIQGCEGLMGNSSGNLAGGDGLRSTSATSSGGANCSTCSAGQGDSGSGGGATAICVGTVPPNTPTQPNNNSPTNNNCTGGAANVLMVAGGGGAGGGVDVFLAFCSGGNGANAGIGQSPTFNAAGAVTSSTVTTGIVMGSAGSNGSCGGGNGGSGGSTTFGPTGSTGNQAAAGCSQNPSIGGGGDGGAGGGGYGGGGAGDAGPAFDIFGFYICQSSAGGGGGSSYLAPSDGSMQLVSCASGVSCLYSQCPSAGQANPAANQTNTTANPIYEAEWCQGQDNTTGAATITDTAVPDSAAILSQSPGLVGSTVW